MVKIRIYSPGKTKESWLDEALAEYLKRLKPVAQIEFIHPKTEKQFIEQALKERRLIALDPQGKTYSSEQFSSLLFDEIEKGGAEVAFAIGAAEGLPKELKSKQLLSLSLLTFTHQMVRLVLVEQIYRAFEIRKGSGYHK
jgi:23S rRNA (pseudouridine1915-N3)-methyltransferase